jgi:three-Cys-motif partner protein
VLHGYLQARLPIMGHAAGYPELVMIDGFAGPGRYQGREKGSPLLMLDAFLEHAASQRITARLRFIFIEKDERRFANLQREIAPYLPRLRRGVTVELYQDPFDLRMDAILHQLGPNPPPVFTFVDPFGISDNHTEVTSRVLGHRGCEVLVYVPLYDIARHIRQPEFERHLNNLFAGGSWRAARDIEGTQDRIALLKNAFEGELAKTCGRVMHIEIRNEHPNGGYFLFFGTSHTLGVTKMKDVFWRIDPTEGRCYWPARKSMEDELLAIDAPPPNGGPLKRDLYARFGRGEFGIEEAEAFTATTRYKITHLRTLALVPLEAHHAIAVIRPPGEHGPKDFPPGTVIRFTRAPSAEVGLSDESAASGYRATANAGV